jgi:hypothetical protein
MVEQSSQWEHQSQLREKCFVLALFLFTGNNAGYLEAGFNYLCYRSFW